MENLEMICLQIISNAGEARSLCMEALKSAREGRISEARQYLLTAETNMKTAHDVHTSLIAMDAAGTMDKISLILVHSEDIMMGAEITRSLVGEMVEMYGRVM